MTRAGLWLVLDTLSTADFNSLNNTSGLFLEVSTCAPKTITTFDTILYSQARQPLPDRYVHTATCAVYALVFAASPCSTLALMTA